MAISVICEECFAEFSVGDQHSGKAGRCAECGAPVRVPKVRRSKAVRAQSARSKRGKEPRRRNDSREMKTASNGIAPWVVIASASVGAVLLIGVAVIAFTMGSNSDETTTETATGDQNLLAAANQQKTNPAPTVNPRPVIKPRPVDPNPVTQTNNTTVTPTPVEPKPNPVPAPAVEPKEPEVKSLADLIEEVEPSVVRIDVETDEGGGNGSGFVVDKTGIVMTNYHVIAGAVKATVVFSDGEELPVAGILRLEQNKDIAVLKVNGPAERFHPIPLATKQPRKGETVFACGAPYGLSFTASDGIVSALRSPTELRELGIDHDGNWIQTTAPISPGNSGGPLINERGQVVAANTMQLRMGQNLNFGISSIDLKSAYDARSSKLTALSSATAPADRTQESRRESIVNAIGEERGRKLMAKIDDLACVVASYRFTVDDDVNKYLIKVIKLQLSQADIRLSRDGFDKPKVLLLIRSKLDSGGRANGAKGLSLSAELLIRDTSGGKTQIVRVWTAEEKIMGSFSHSDLSRGAVPTRVRLNVHSFMKEFIETQKSAEKEFGK